MNSLALILMVIVGAVLIYASVTGNDPRDLLKSALSKGGK